MPNQIHIDRRVLYSFMLIMTVINAVIFFIPWKEIMAGKNDFPPLYASAQMVREGQASCIYDLEVENSYVRRISDVTRPPNNHLPYENLIFIPLTYMQFRTAFICWTLLSLAMLILVALMTCDMWPDTSSFGFTLLTILAFFPVWYCLLQGQDSILLLLLFALSFWLGRRGHHDLAGFVLALGLFRPQLVLPFAFVMFLGRRWKFIRGFIPGIICVVALSVWIVGFHGMADYARILISQGTQGSASALVEQWHVQPSLMTTLRGLLWISLPSLAPRIVQTVLLLAGTSLGLLWAAKGIRGAKQDATFELAFAIAVAVVVLVSFHSFLHDFSIIILPVLVVANLILGSTRLTQRSAYSIVTLGFVLFLTPFYLVLLATAKLGLLVLPTVAALGLASQWGALGKPVVADERNTVRLLESFEAPRV
ncbi:MAG: glycosyltransferase family 87 protein [Candidatus Acidiferrales bacterium]